MTRPFETAAVPRTQWATGDYVVGQVFGPANWLYRLELNTGRMVEAVPGDLVVGAFGKRAATLEGVGDWEEIGADMTMEALTGAGLFGKATSTSPFLPQLMSLQYCGHIIRNGKKVCMGDFVPNVPSRVFDIPTVLVIGTSMSAGKTTAARIIVRELKRAGLEVAAAKLTGAARYRDMLAFGDAGADHIFDFVDVGLPSTVCPADEFTKVLNHLLSEIASVGVDVLVAEAGASPLEPYNGATVIETLEDNIAMTVLCASDPYAVVGVQNAFAHKTDLVTGPAANTEAAIALVEKLAGGVKALNLMTDTALPELRQMLAEKLELQRSGDSP